MIDFATWCVTPPRKYDASALDDVQKADLEALWKSETTPAVPPKTPTTVSYEEEVAAHRRENERIIAIQKIAADATKANVHNRDKIEAFDKLCKDAIADGWNLQKFELAMLREERSVGQMFYIPTKQQVTGEAVEAALCRAGGLANLEESFDAQTLEVSHKTFKNGIGLHEVIGLCAQQNGWHGRTVKGDLRNAMKYASQGSEMMAAGGPSTLDITGILSNTANKYSREQFMFGEQVWRRITAVHPVNDFKQITTYSLTGDLTYDKVAPGGEIKHGTLSEVGYTNQAGTYAKMLGIDRQQLINDDLNALAQVGRRLGRGGILKLNDVFWTAFLANSTFFTTGHLNYLASATDSLMNLTGIDKANALFLNQIDPDGKPTGINPKIVLVPPGLMAAAKTLLFSPQLNLATSTAASTGTSSPWEGMFELEVSRYLANSSYTGYSTLAWYLLADPNDTPVIETVFLNGAEVPTIETTELDFNRLGIAMRAYHDFGVSLQEYRGGVRMKGEA